MNLSQYFKPDKKKKRGKRKLMQMAEHIKKIL